MPTPLRTFRLESLSEGFIQALEGWAAWIADPTGHANDTKAGLCSKLLHYEGLNPVPERAITPNEAAGLRALVGALTRVRGMDAASRANHGINDAYLRAFCTGPMTRPGWVYIRDALGLQDANGNAIDVLPLTLRGIDTYRPQAWEVASTADELTGTLRRAGYTRPGPPATNYDSANDLIEPGSYSNANEYENMMSALGVVEPSASTTAAPGPGRAGGPPGGGGNPGGGPAGDPNREGPGEGV